MSSGMSRRESGKLGFEKSKKANERRCLKIRTDYEGNPKKCKNCLEDLPYEKRFLLFCSLSCSAKYNNKGVKRHGEDPKNCLFCDKKLNNTTKIYCNSKCQHEYAWKNLKEKIKNGMYSSGFSGIKVIKRFCVEERGEKCEKCGLSEWQGEKIPLNVHHKDGDAYNNKPDNLELICLNCHGITDNYGRLNKNCTREYRYKNSSFQT